jgi:hypothetical protein
MRVRVRRVCTHMTRVIGLVGITSLVPLPAVAAGPASSGTTRGIKASMERIVARDVAAKPAREPLVREARQAGAPGGSPGFFRTGPGVIALAVMAAGTGYAIYSAQHDRIHSAGKK